MDLHMAFESGALDATIAAAAGDNTALMAELRATFVESARRQLDLLRRSRCDGNWSVAAMRLKGLAASFHVEDLMQLAQHALDGVPSDPAILRQIDCAIQKLSGS